jgi:hypothetical protein
MSSVWLTTRTTASGAKRYRVEYRLGGREAPTRYGGSFRTQREALARKAWVAGELAALRVPNLQALETASRSQTVAAAGQRWLGSRIDVAPATKTRHGLELARIDHLLGRRLVDELAPAEIADFVATLATDYSRATIRKTLQTLAMVLDHEGISPNPARDKEVRLPREDQEEISDEQRRRVRLRAATTKTRKALWVELHPVLADALEARLGPREDRNIEACLFAGSGADALRTSMAKACKAAGIPLFSPHDLRHRRISLLHLRGVPWARIGEFVGQRNLSVTADVYSHVMLDEAELDYAALVE